MKRKIIEVYKMLSGVSKFVIGVSGLFFVLLLCMWSIVFIKGGVMDKAQLDLRPLVASSTLAWIWIGTLTVFTISMGVGFGNEIRKGISKARDPKLSAEEKGRSLFLWLLKH